MKFGEGMTEMMHEPWLGQYLNYGSLKQFIKRIGMIEAESSDASNFDRRQISLSDAEEGLWLSIQQQLAKVNEFMSKEIQSIDEELTAVSAQIDQVKCLQKFLLDKGMFNPEDQIEEWVLDGLYGPKTEEAVGKWTAQGHDAGQLPECDKTTVDRLAGACCKLDMVRQYGMLNYIALLKIVKKHAKWSKSKSIQDRVRAMLPDQYLYRGDGIFELVCRCEAIVAGDISLGRARVEEGNSWMETRLVQSKLFTMLARSEADVSFPQLPWTLWVRDGASSSTVGTPDQACSPLRSLERSSSRHTEEIMEMAVNKATPVKNAKSSPVDQSWSGHAVGEDIHKEKGPRVFKIALTGGPCAGKTSSLSHISDYFRSRGWRVYTSREAASVVLGGGINFANFGSEQAFECQKAIVEVMCTLEQSYTNICRAGEPGEKCMVLCDRGIMDASVYCDKACWDRILSEMGLDHAECCDARYDAVIHLVTAADGAEEFYTLETNEDGVRLESAEQARELDKRTGAAWSSHPAHVIIDNSTDFKGKLLRVVASICSVVGVPMPSRTVKRRKYLVSSANLARAGFTVSTSDCEFTYLISSDGMQHRLRRRTMEGTYLYTHILRSISADGEMFDVKRNIDRNQYLALLAHQDPDRMLIRLVRQNFVYKNRNFQLSTVLGVTPKSQIASSRSSPRASPRAFEGIQLLSVWTDEAGDVDLPGAPALQVEKEVTGKPEYSLFHLSNYRKVPTSPSLLHSGTQTPPTSPLKFRGASTSSPKKQSSEMKDIVI